MEIFELIHALEEREVQIENKLQKLVESNANPFPMGRIQKGKLLLKLIYEFKKHVEEDDFIQAGMRLRDLELEGLVIYQKK